MVTPATLVIVLLIVASVWAVWRIYLGELMALLYVALEKEGPGHALALRERISRRGGDGHDFSIGTAYVALRRLERLGLIEGWDDYANLPPARGGRPRRIYRVRGTT